MVPGRSGRVKSRCRFSSQGSRWPLGEAGPLVAQTPAPGTGAPAPGAVDSCHGEPGVVELPRLHGRRGCRAQPKDDRRGVGGSGARNAETGASVASARYSARTIARAARPIRARLLSRRSPAGSVGGDEIVKAAILWRSIKLMSNQRIADRLQITAQESAAQAAEFGKRAWPPMTGVEYEPPPVPRVLSTRDAGAAKRREVIRAIVHDHRGDLPSVRETGRMLEAMGMPASVSTVHADLRAVGMGRTVQSCAFRPELAPMIPTAQQGSARRYASPRLALACWAAGAISRRARSMAVQRQKHTGHRTTH
jgi:hypothetical protein